MGLLKGLLIPPCDINCGNKIRSRAKLLQNILCHSLPSTGLLNVQQLSCADLLQLEELLAKEHDLNSPLFFHLLLH